MAINLRGDMSQKRRHGSRGRGLLAILSHSQEAEGDEQWCSAPSSFVFSLEHSPQKGAVHIQVESSN